MKKLLLLLLCCSIGHIVSAQMDSEQMLCGKWWSIRDLDVKKTDTLYFYSSERMTFFSKGMRFYKDKRFVRQLQCAMGEQPKSWRLKNSILEIYFRKTSYRKSEIIWRKFKILRMTRNTLNLIMIE